MLTGKKAFGGQSAAALLSAVIRDDPKPVSELRRDIPLEVRQIVKRCLNKDPEARYSSAAELAQELRTCWELLFPESGVALTPARIAREARRPLVLVPLLLVLAALGAAVLWQVKHYREVRWARMVAVPQISRLFDEGKLSDAYALAEKAEKSISDDPMLAKLWPLISYQVSIETTPPGANVYRTAYGDASAPWQLVGRTPLKSVRQPRGTYIWKFEKQGFGTVLRTTIALFNRFSAAPNEAMEDRKSVV